MNLWLRLISVLIRAFARPRCGLLDETVLRVRIWPNDLDIHGHVNNGRYLTLADLARLDFAIRTRLALLAIRSRAVPVMGDVTAKYRREARLFDTVEIRTRLLGWDSNWSYLEHRLLRGDKVVAVITARGVFRTARGAGAIPPAGLVQAAGGPADSPELPPAIRMWSASCDAAMPWCDD